MISMAKPILDESEIKAVENVLKSGHLAHGKVVEEFETAFAEYIGCKHAIAVSSGTSALHLSLLAIDVYDSEVITTPFSFSATGNSILLANGNPTFVDIDDVTFNIDVEKIENSITDSTKVIMPVHLYGQSCDMKKIMHIAEKYKLYVVEDACQSHGSEWNNKKVGSFGVGCFSFYPTKNMAIGEGGMITTNDDEIAEKVKILRNHGQTERYNCSHLGYNYRMTNISASLGLSQLKKLDSFNNKRIQNANRYNELLKDIKGLEIPFANSQSKHVYHQYTIKIKYNFGLTRDEVKEELYKKGITTEVYYPKLIPDQNLYKDMGFSSNHLFNASKITEQVLSLPVHPSITIDDVDFVCEQICKLKR
jgi:perosamine synthetase